MKRIIIIILIIVISLFATAIIITNTVNDLSRLEDDLKTSQLIIELQKIELNACKSLRELDNQEIIWSSVICVTPDLADDEYYAFQPGQCMKFRPESSSGGQK